MDQFWAEQAYQTIDVLKIDTEGADTWVREVASQMLKEKKEKTYLF